MHANRRRLLRLVAVVAIITAALVPAVAGAAEDYQCDGNHYDATNPDHVLYGVSAQTPVVNDRLLLDLSLRTPVSGTFVVFWDGYPLGDLDGAVIVGSNFPDVICGTADDDTVYGMQGNDRIFGMGGGAYIAPNLAAVPPVVESWGDYLFGNKGNDLIVDGANPGDLGGGGSFIGGGVGNDVIYSGDGDDSYARGGRGDDTMFAGDGDYQEIRGGGDNDTVKGGTGDYQHIFGNIGDDFVFGGAGTGQVIEGNVGADELTGGSGTGQRLYGGLEDDTLEAGSGTNQALFGDGGNDEINDVGSGANQVADGGSGNDKINPSTTSAFWAFGGVGDDTIVGGSAADHLWGDYAVDAAELTAEGFPGVPGLVNTAFVNAAASGADWIAGGTGADSLFGGPGNDTLFGNKVSTVDQLDTMDGAADDMFGNTGADTAFGACVDSDLFNGGTDPAIDVSVDISWRFYAIKITGVEDPRLPCV